MTSCGCGAIAANSRRCVECPIGSTEGSRGMPYGGLHDAEGVRRSVNLLTSEEPTDWGGGSGPYDAFVEVVAAG